MYEVICTHPMPGQHTSVNKAEVQSTHESESEAWASARGLLFAWNWLEAQDIYVREPDGTVSSLMDR